MNGASDLNLALAIESAGAMPSLLFNMRDAQDRIDFSDATRQLSEFRSATGHTNIIVGVHHRDVIETKFIDWLRENRPSHIEIIGNKLNNNEYLYDPRWPIMMSAIKKITKIMIRINAPTEYLPWVDGFCIKGQESAGVGGGYKVKDLTKKQIDITPRVAIIPYGGVGTAEQVKEYIDMGATAIASGTLFAASKESPLTDAVKQSIASADISDLVTLADTNQKILPLGPVDSIIDTRGDWNREQSLKNGISGDGTIGHIYMGESIQYIDRIKTVKEIVDDLVSLL